MIDSRLVLLVARFNRVSQIFTSGKKEWLLLLAGGDKNCFLIRPADDLWLREVALEWRSSNETGGAAGGSGFIGKSVISYILKFDNLFCSGYYERDGVFSLGRMKDSTLNNFKFSLINEGEEFLFSYWLDDKNLYFD